MGFFRGGMGAGEAEVAHAELMAGRAPRELGEHTVIGCPWFTYKHARRMREAGICRWEGTDLFK